jgi:protein SCO1/2
MRWFYFINMGERANTEFMDSGLAAFSFRKFGVLLGLLVAVESMAAPGGRAPIGAGTSREMPKELKAAGITEKLGDTVDLEGLRFTNEAGEEVTLASYFKRGKPVVLSIVYYECPSLCTFVLNGLTDALDKFQWTPGKEFEVVSVSMNHRETPELAQTKKNAYLDALDRPEIAGGWHFLVGTEAMIKKLTNQLGFGFQWDPDQKQYAHSAALMILTAQGRISRYLYGIQYSLKDLRLALLEASEGKIGTLVDRVLMFCYQYDPSSRGYSLVAFRLVQLGSAITVLLVSFYLFWFWRRQTRVRVAAKEAEPVEPA